MPVIIYAILGSAMGLGWCWSAPAPHAREYVVLVAYVDARMSDPIDFEEAARYHPTPSADEICALDRTPDPDVGGVEFIRIITHE